LGLSRGEDATADIECHFGGEFGHRVGYSARDSGSLYQGHRSPPSLKRRGELETRRDYLRDPRVVFLRCDWRCFVFFLFGLLMLKVPLPRYSALYSFSFTGVSANLFCSVPGKIG
jgi:hypothetical protein